MKAKILCALGLFLFAFSSAFSISIERNVFPNEIQPDQYITVSVTVKREGTAGFAKIQEELPAGFEIKVLEEAGAKFFQDGNKIRWIWLDMPETEEIVVRYRLHPEEGTVPKKYTISGKFNYIVGSDRKLIDIKASDFTILKPKEEQKKKEIIIADDQKSENFTGSDVLEETAEEEKEETSEPKDVQADLKVEVDAVEKDKAKSNGIVYKVQLGAFSKEKSKSIFGDLPDIHFDKVNGLYKYYSGKFSTEEEARAIVAKAKKSGFPGAFLVKFKDGKRI